MPTLDATIEFELYCSEHPANKLDCEIRKIMGFDSVFVAPCDDCIQESYGKGMDDGTAH